MDIIDRLMGRKKYRGKNYYFSRIIIDIVASLWCIYQTVVLIINGNVQYALYFLGMLVIFIASAIVKVKTYRKEKAETEKLNDFFEDTIDLNEYDLEEDEPEREWMNIEDHYYYGKA